jgi:hypothetical protein
MSSIGKAVSMALLTMTAQEACCHVEMLSRLRFSCTFLTQLGQISLDENW